MEQQEVYLVYDRVTYIDTPDGRVRKSNPCIETVMYNTPMDLAVRLNNVRDLSERLNKELVFTDKHLAEAYANQLRTQS